MAKTILTILCILLSSSIVWDIKVIKDYSDPRCEAMALLSNMDIEERIGLLQDALKKDMQVFLPPKFERFRQIVERPFSYNIGDTSEWLFIIDKENRDAFFAELEKIPNCDALNCKSAEKLHTLHNQFFNLALLNYITTYIHIGDGCHFGSPYTFIRDHESNVYFGKYLDEVKRTVVFVNDEPISEETWSTEIEQSDSLVLSALLITRNKNITQSRIYDSIYIEKVVKI